MHRSGIVCDQTIKDQFNACVDDSSIIWMKVEIEDENFVKTGQGNGNVTSLEENFGICKSQLKAKSPCYILLKNPSGKWLLMYFVPDNSPVKKKMLIASSYADLKKGLGDTNFSGEYAMSEENECTLAAYTASIKTGDDSIMTWQERDEKESMYEASMTMSETKVSAVVSVDIPLTDDCVAAIVSYQEGKVNTVVFSLDGDKEELNCAESGNMTLDELPGKLPEREPRYILHNYSHDRDGTTKVAGVFIYYCPDKSKPRLRMFYSTGKANVLAVLTEKKIPEPKRLEISLTSELTTQAVLDELYPKSSIKKVFKKPTRQGKGRAKFHGKKFTAS